MGGDIVQISFGRGWRRGLASPPRHMEIRRTKFSDIPNLSELTRRIIATTPYYSALARKEEIKKHDARALRQMLGEPKYYYCFVGLEDGKIVSFSIGRNEAGVYWGDWFGVMKNYRRRGFALAILKYRNQVLKKEKIHKIWSDTRSVNKESIALLGKMGHRKLGFFRNGWYKQDFFLWEKDL